MSIARSHPAATILVVDDDAAIIKLVKLALHGAGYDVLSAEGGRDAIRIFEDWAGPVHLLLTDVIMPDLTGPVVAERLRQRQPDLQVLFMSGFHDAELVQRFASDQGLNFLPKPFTVESLLRSVQDVLSLGFGRAMGFRTNS